MFSVLNFLLTVLRFWKHWKALLNWIGVKTVFSSQLLIYMKNRFLDFAITFLWESCLHFEMTYLQAYRLSTDTAISPGNQISSPHTRSLSTCTVITPNWIENRVNIEVCFQILKDNRKVFKSIRVLQPLSQSFGAILRNRSYFSKFKVSCTCHHYAG